MRKKYFNWTENSKSQPVLWHQESQVSVHQKDNLSFHRLHRQMEPVARGALQNITYYKPPPKAYDNYITLLNQQNNFLGGFEALNMTAQKTHHFLSMTTFCAFPQPASRNHSQWQIPTRLLVWTKKLVFCWDQIVRTINTTLSLAFCPALIPHPPVHDRLSCENSLHRFQFSIYTTIPLRLIKKLNLVSLKTLLCNCMLDFLTKGPQSVNTSKHYHTKHKVPPKMSDLSPAFHPASPWLCTNLQFCSFCQFVDDITVVGLISNNDKSSYIVTWCKD